MRITVTIPDEVVERVQARGLTPESYVERLIEDAAPTALGSVNPVPPKRDMHAFFRDMAAHSEKIPQLPDEAFTRKSFYQDHD